MVCRRAPLPVFASWCTSVPNTLVCKSVLFFIVPEYFDWPIVNWFLCCFRLERQWFKLDLRVVHVRDLNFKLRSKIFVHWDGQLWASHLILGVDLVYSTWQAFAQALLVDSPFLSYIDVRHANFLPPKLTIGKAQDLGLWYTCSAELAPIRDESAEYVSLRCREQAHERI